MLAAAVIFGAVLKSTTVLPCLTSEILIRFLVIPSNKAILAMKVSPTKVENGKSNFIVTATTGV